MMISDEVEEEFPTTLFAPVKPVPIPIPPVKESASSKLFSGVMMFFWYILVGPFYYSWSFLKLAVMYGQKEEIENQQNEQTIIGNDNLIVF